MTIRKIQQEHRGRGTFLKNAMVRVVIHDPRIIRSESICPLLPRLDLLVIFVTL
jgi:hypothetical protein